SSRTTFPLARVMTIGGPNGLHACETTASMRTGPRTVTPTAPAFTTRSFTNRVLPPGLLAADAIPPKRNPAFRPGGPVRAAFKDGSSLTSGTLKGSTNMKVATESGASPAEAAKPFSEDSSSGSGAAGRSPDEKVWNEQPGSDAASTETPGVRSSS